MWSLFPCPIVAVVFHIACLPVACGGLLRVPIRTNDLAVLFGQPCPGLSGSQSMCQRPWSTPLELLAGPSHRVGTVGRWRTVSVYRMPGLHSLGLGLKHMMVAKLKDLGIQLSRNLSPRVHVAALVGITAGKRLSWAVGVVCLLLSLVL